MTTPPQVLCSDVLEALATLPAESVDLIIADPPYHRVLKEAWDRENATAAGFGEWLREVLTELRRVAKPEATLWCFGWASHSWRVAAAADAAGWAVQTTVVWDKQDSPGWVRKASRSTLRKPFTASEHIVMATAGTQSGPSFHWCCESARLRLCRLRDAAGLTNSDVDRALGCNGMAGHWFGVSQWEFPSVERFEQLVALFEMSVLAARDEMLAARDEWLAARRPFTLGENNPQRPAVDCWRFAPAPRKANRHPAEKPELLIAHLIETCSRPGDLVLDPFAGSGVVGQIARETGRQWIGIERDPAWAKRALARAQQAPQATLSFPIGQQ